MHTPQVNHTLDIMQSTSLTQVGKIYGKVFEMLKTAYRGRWRKSHTEILQIYFFFCLLDKIHLIMTRPTISYKFREKEESNMFDVFVFANKKLMHDCN